MDLKTSKRNVIGILIITLIFGIFSVISLSKMFNNTGDDYLIKSDYITALETELGIELNQEDDFANFALIEDEMLIIPAKYQYYFKPCFDFVIAKDGVFITNRLAKEFDELGFEVGMKITQVDSVALEGKGYFEILELMLAKNIGDKKTFTHSEGQIEYTYKGYNDRYEYNEEENILYIYNLDNVSRETIHEVYSSNPNVAIDLSMATVNTYEGVRNFVSMFAADREVLFAIPENVIATTPRKISDVSIVLGDNEDDGILFALTAIKSYKANVKIVKNLTDESEVFVNQTVFNALNPLSSSTYTIYLKNNTMKTKVVEVNGDVA